MPPADADLTVLVTNPREDLHIEVKSWLDLSSPVGKATIAKAIIALANHGGGFVLIGFEDQGGVLSPDGARPASLDGYSQDIVNGVVQSYANPAFHCRVHHVVNAATGKLHPVVVVPGGHKVPVQAVRGSPDQRTMVNGKYYIRRQGPQSAEPATPEEWRDLVMRCVRAGREDLLDAIRDVLAGRTPQEQLAPEARDVVAELVEWAEPVTQRWLSGGPLNQYREAKRPHGYFRIAYLVNGAFDRRPWHRLLELLERSTIRHNPLRLGFPVKVMGQPGLKSNDTRRWQRGPHLKTSLEYVDAILDYLARHHIRMYRLSSDLAPYATHPDMPQFHGMVAESKPELRALGANARKLDIRLSFHPSQYILLNSPDPELTRKSIWDLSSQAEMLDLMELGPEAVLVIHVGGVYDDREASRARWVETWHGLPEPVRRRLVLEHDDRRFSAADVLWIHEQTGVRLVFDYQHFWCLNSERLDMVETIRRILATWPTHVRPKLHYSSPRTEFRAVKRREQGSKRKKTVYLPPVWTGHADFTNPFEFARFMRDCEGLEFECRLLQLGLGASSRSATGRTYGESSKPE